MSSQIYRSASASRTPMIRVSIGFAMVVAALLALIGIAAMIAGLTGVTGIEPLGVLRSIFYMGLGLVGAGAGGLLLLALDSMSRPVHRARGESGAWEGVRGAADRGLAE